MYKSSGILSRVDGLVNQISPVNALVNLVVDRVIPKATAKAACNFGCDFTQKCSVHCDSTTGIVYDLFKEFINHSGDCQYLCTTTCQRATSITC